MTTNTNSILQKQASLPQVIPLLRYEPARRPFAIQTFDPATVRSPDDLPPYLVMGPLDASSFKIATEGWSVTYRGSQADSWLSLSFDLPRGIYSLQQVWRGVEGGFSQAQGTMSLDEVVGQLLYMRFPSRWDPAAKEQFEQAFQLRYFEQPPDQPSFCGIPDGAFRTIAFPFAVTRLRNVKTALTELVAAQGASYPVAAEAQLVTQEVHYHEGLFSNARAMSKFLVEQSLADTGTVPLSRLDFALAPNGLAVRTLRRCAYLVCVTLPFVGIDDLLTRLSSPAGPVRGRTDPGLRSELTPLVLPTGLDRFTRDIDVWVDGQPSGIRWHFADPYGRSAADGRGEAMWTEPRIEGLLLAAERIVSRKPTAEPKPRPEPKSEPELDPELESESELEPELTSIDELDDDDFRSRMVKMLPKLLRNVAFRSAVEQALGAPGPQVVTAVRKGLPLDEGAWDELKDAVPDTFGELAKPVVTLSWEATSPMGSSGFSEIVELAGVYVFSSSDWATKGPFDSLGEALDNNESFSMPTSGADLTSYGLPRKKLLQIARGLADENEPIWVDGEKFVQKRGRLRCVEDD